MWVSFLLLSVGYTLWIVCVCVCVVFEEEASHNILTARKLVSPPPLTQFYKRNLSLRNRLFVVDHENGVVHGLVHLESKEQGMISKQKRYVYTCVCVCVCVEGKREHHFK